MSSTACATLRVAPRASRRTRRAPPARLAPSAASSDAGRGDEEAVRYGLLGGSVAYYPRGGDATTSSNATLPRADTEPTTRYEDGPLDRAAIALFNAKLRTAVEDDSDGHGTPVPPAIPLSGFPRLVALADLIASGGRPPAAQRQVVLVTLLGLIPAQIRRLFKILIKPSDWVDRMNALITVNAFAWLVGPCEIVPRESDGLPAAVKLRKCRYLEQCGCTASCVNFCKMPTQGFFRDAFGVDAHLAPNHEDGSCVMTFGTPPPAKDPAFEEGCYSSCGRSGGCGAGEGDARTPCHRLGEQSPE